MVDFDAELYLRMLGERQLLEPDQQRRHRSSPLDGPAAALVAAERITPTSAQRVIIDYTSAMSVRADERGFPHSPPPGRRRPGHLTPRRTAILDQEIALGPGRMLLRSLTTAKAGGTLHFHWRRDGPATSGSRRMMGHPGGFPWGPAAPVIADDRGNLPMVSSGSGGGNNDHWDGKLNLAGKLAPDTAWLEVEGTRIAVDRRTAAHEVSIEPLADTTGIERFLWRRLAVAEMPFGGTPDLEPAIEALLAAGALDGEDRLVREVRAVAAQLPDNPRHSHRSGGGGGRGLPEPWRSLLRRRGREDGPSGMLVVGALTPRFDGIQLAVGLVISDPLGFDVEFEVAPNVLHRGAIDEPPFAWWARDDRGNHHLSFPSQWGGSHDNAQGTMRFWPALDPKAIRLDLMPTADTQRAVISISLAQLTQAGA